MGETRADPQRAFRAGLGVAELGSAPAPGLAEAAVPWATGGNEALVLAMTRLPGLSDPRAAFETGRALRLIARLLDEAGAPPRVGEQFRDNLVAAVIAHATRRTGRPWDAADTVAMFMELYRRGLERADSEPGRVEAALLRWARQELRPLPGRREPRGGVARLAARLAA
jgi:hypothetical protein